MHRVDFHITRSAVPLALIVENSSASRAREFVDSRFENSAEKRRKEKPGGRFLSSTGLSAFSSGQWRDVRHVDSEWKKLRERIFRDGATPNVSLPLRTFVTRIRGFRFPN